MGWLGRAWLGPGWLGRGLLGRRGLGSWGLGMGWLEKPRLGEWGGRGSLPLLLMRSSCLLDGAGLSALWISGAALG